MPQSRPMSVLKAELDALQATYQSLGDDIARYREEIIEGRNKDRENRRYNYRCAPWERESEDNEKQARRSLEATFEQRDEVRSKLIAIRAELRGAATSAILPRRSTPSDIGPRVNGTVKWYSSERGFGFIAGSGEKDIFVPASSLRESNALAQGDRVNFKITPTPKGPKAVDVRFDTT